MSVHIVRHLSCYDSDTYDTRDRLMFSVAAVAAVTVIAGVNSKGNVVLPSAWRPHLANTVPEASMRRSRMRHDLVACPMVGADLLNDFGFGGAL